MSSDGFATETPFKDVLGIGLRNGLTRPRAQRGEGTLMVNMKEVFAHRRIGQIEMERVPLNEKNPAADLLEPSDLLFARQSLTAEGAGKCVLFLGADEPVTFESHILRARVDVTRADPRFLFYLFSSPLGRRRVGSIVNQVAAAGIRGSELASLLLPIPSLADQRASAAVLGRLDDKIESNGRQSQLLQDAFMAYWDRVAIAADRSGTRLGDLVSARRGAGDQGKPYIGLDQMPRGSTVLTEWLEDDAPSSSVAFAVGDILFGKLRPYFRKVGVAPIDGRCSTEILVLRPLEAKYFGLALGHVFSQQFIDHCNAVSTGTRMPRAEWKNAQEHEIGLPDDDSLEHLSDLATVHYDHIVHLTLESRRLRAIRDELLPKLVSGTIRVPAAEEIVEAGDDAALEEATA